MHVITSPANDLIKDVIRLKKAGQRKKQDLVIVDGEREILAALKADWELTALYYSGDLNAKRRGAQDYLGVSSDKVLIVTEDIFKKISFKENPDGFLALFRTKESKLQDIKLSKSPLLIILENVEKPGNLGAIIRTAAAAGVNGIIVNDNQTDPYNPNVIRASEGEVFSQMIVKSSCEDTLAWLKENKIRSLAAATDNSEDYSKADLVSPVAIVLGSEARGLSSKWLEEADQVINIPMAGGIDSLNVSVAAVIVFEAARQRRQKSAKK